MIYPQFKLFLLMNSRSNKSLFCARCFSCSILRFSGSYVERFFSFGSRLSVDWR